MSKKVQYTCDVTGETLERPVILKFGTDESDERHLCPEVATAVVAKLLAKCDQDLVANWARRNGLLPSVGKKAEHATASPDPAPEAEKTPKKRGRRKKSEIEAEAAAKAAAAASDTQVLADPPSDEAIDDMLAALDLTSEGEVPFSEGSESEVEEPAMV